MACCGWSVGGNSRTGRDMTVILLYAAASVVPPFAARPILKILPSRFCQGEECRSSAIGALVPGVSMGLAAGCFTAGGMLRADGQLPLAPTMFRTADLRQLQATGVELRGVENGHHRGWAVRIS